MHPPSSLLLLLTALLTTTTATPLPPPQTPLLPPSSSFCSSSSDSARIPTPYESALQARHILRTTPLGVLSSIFPPNNTSSSPRNDHPSRPPSVAHTPIGLPEYIADCEPDGNPLILAITIATPIRNARTHPNVSLSIASKDEDGHEWDSPAAHPRFALQGWLERVPDAEVKQKGLDECYFGMHPDARRWAPGSGVHAAYWARLRVEAVYWFGGFGDRAYIGWIGMGDWWAAGGRAGGWVGEEGGRDGGGVERGVVD